MHKLSARATVAQILEGLRGEAWLFKQLALAEVAQFVKELRAEYRLFRF